MITNKDMQNPEQLTKKLSDRPASQIEIRSHSSILTNKRLDELFSAANNLSIQAFSATTIPNVHWYFSTINQIITETYTLVDVESFSEIVELIKKYWEVYFYFMSATKNSRIDTRKVFDMLFFVNKIDQLIRGALQKKQYFYKVGERDIKDIDRAIEIVRSGGGIFGENKRVQDMDEGEQKSDAPVD